MPSLNFVLPHWLYWGTLIVFPLLAMYFVKRQKQRGTPQGPSLFIAYMFCLCAGFMGLHRLYLRNMWGLIFIPVFLAILYTNDEMRDRREDVSRTRAAVERSHTAIRRAEIPPNVSATPRMTERLKRAQSEGSAAEQQFAQAQADLDRWRGYSRWLAILMAAMLLTDAVLLPGTVRRASESEAAERRLHPPAAEAPPHLDQQGTGEDPTLAVHTRLTDKIELLNIRVGEFAAYWAVISVFVYYYEVIARFVFNSPTNWVHESMFLMYGMQYMLAGAYAYREDQHVRVDVIYTKFSPRGKAAADIVTSVFFFIFIGVLFWTSWRFAADAINNNEHSFTEWGVQYWSVKLMMPIGAGLLFLQGISKLIKDVAFLARGRA
ncbi:MULTISPECIES: TRAP transporter small permease subunit [unclassified Bradyrhizobium]|uniref:TRAP transporter small permease subunit n=1 Tax=unclassified Bradyrhizobium TaxID=2631580 RepID=UPI002479CBDD|nr:MULTISPECIES: TRAP transporter small permease subunit [unclassified Bradyrhizobium]WGR72459.1 TRAP transporter small permease subunit [Bradyrhizobium sp. ISRA426]WGR77292.1 TRAP transporter small permease subunit [Bradyrhizobium sp. ISRA430]WGR87698.1 TRAP transporter small permease subunit [Bradyrhizobium sp. ISRA432]